MNTSSVITAEELKQRLDAGQVDFLFDLRNADEFRAWRIEGRKDFTTLNIPQEVFVGEEEGHLAKFPRDKVIVTVCAHGDASKYAADLLLGQGLSAVSLMGGMDAWSEFYEARQVVDDPAVFQIYRVARGCIAYLIVSKGDAVVIDAGRHLNFVLDLAKSNNARILHVLDTHLHADHISGGRELAARSSASYHLHPADAEGAAYPYLPLADGQIVAFGSSRIEVIHGPGHTPGSSSFLLDKKYLFTGDTIMKTGMGRPDLGGKAGPWSLLLHDTLFRRYKDLDDDVIVLPSHAASLREQDAAGLIMTTMGEARKNRDLFRIPDESAFVRFIQANLLENPERYQDIRKVNLGSLLADESRQKELEIGKNLCGMAKKDKP